MSRLPSIAPHALALTLALALTSACNTFTDTNLEAHSCVATEDCDPGAACIDGFCQLAQGDVIDETADSTTPSDAGFDRACGTTVCAEHEQCCGLGQCTDVRDDRENCGGCGVRCSASEACIDGVCTCGDDACGPNQLCCNDSCIDPATDPLHCGTCGTTCGENTFCTDGRCSCEGPGGASQTCTSGQVCCPGLGCRTLESDARACGACGNACRPGESCVDGQCTCGSTGDTCGPSEACCGSPARCRAADDPSCGCGEVTCRSGYACCTGAGGEQVCVDNGTNEDHCGSCGNACGTGAACSAGRCSCDPGRSDCDGNPLNGCETHTSTDPDNCGSCGNACSANQTCCDGACVDRRTSTQHCGACGNVCPVRANASSGCSSGNCTQTCNTGYANCDGDLANGCEVNTRTSTQHCGACSNVCPARANAATSCTSGTCSFTCLPGFADCDGNAANGCEVDTRSSLSHCGACNSPCARLNATTICSSGTCELLTCNVGYADCDSISANGCETNIFIDSQNCGQCGLACISICFGGLCN